MLLEIKTGVLLPAWDAVKADGGCTCFTVPTDH